MQWLKFVYRGRSMRAPVINSRAHKIRRSQSKGTHVARCEPSNPPGMEPTSSVSTKVGSTFPSRKWRKPVTPVSTTACTISVPTLTLGGKLTKPDLSWHLMKAVLGGCLWEIMPYAFG
jgi:hypothetical protein